MAELDEHAARELRLHVDNVESHYRQVAAIHANMARHWVRGDFTRAQSIRGYRHAVDNAARSYQREYGSPWGPKLFGPAERDAVATSFADDFLSLVRRPELWDDLGDKAAAILRKHAGVTP